MMKARYWASGPRKLIVGENVVSAVSKFPDGDIDPSIFGGTSIDTRNLPFLVPIGFSVVCASKEPPLLLLIVPSLENDVSPFDNVDSRESEIGE